MDRFVTAADLIEIAVTRNLADLFNDFIEDGTLTGPLSTVTDLTPQDVQTMIDIQARCRENVQPNGATAQQHVDTCAMFGYLDGAMVAALLTHFDAGIDGAITDTTALPSDYFTALGTEDRDRVATALIAQSITGEKVPRQVELPDEWLLEKPVLITFSFSDIPLAVLSVSADLSREELRHLVENEIVPRLEALDAIADVSIEGGENIRPDLLNEALEAEGLSPETDGELADTDVAQAHDETDLDDGAANATEATANTPDIETLEEGPALGAVFRAASRSGRTGHCQRFTAYTRTAAVDAA
ncbi:MAG: hypothetical protein K8S97_03210 [Anaerolineae bacterium]|nr:hypothetical protein [Anaerolineae bacterium]